MTVGAVWLKRNQISKTIPTPLCVNSPAKTAFYAVREFRPRLMAVSARLVGLPFIIDALRRFSPHRTPVHVQRAARLLLISQRTRAQVHGMLKNRRTGKILRVGHHPGEVLGVDGVK